MRSCHLTATTLVAMPTLLTSCSLQAGQAADALVAACDGHHATECITLSCVVCSKLPHRLHSTSQTICTCSLLRQHNTRACHREGRAHF